MQITDPAGRTLGVDPLTKEYTNDFGASGIDSGPESHPRIYTLLDPEPGGYSMDVTGTGAGPYIIEVFSSTDGAQPSGSSVQLSGIAAVGSRRMEDVSYSSNSNVEEDPILPGDINGDWSVGIDDVIHILRIYVGLRVATEREIAVGDLSPIPGTGGRYYGDGQLSGNDINMILRQSIGL